MICAACLCMKNNMYLSDELQKYDSSIDRLENVTSWLEYVLNAQYGCAEICFMSQQQKSSALNSQALLFH